MALTKEEMPETMYRASRFFRVLGNPTAYLILRSLGNGIKTPSQLSKEIGVSRTLISATLRHLRQVNLVRYKTVWKTKEYWVKDPHVQQLLAEAEELVEAMREKQ